MPGWIHTGALATGGTGHDQLAVAGSQIASSTITANNLVPNAGNAGRYDASQYDRATYA